MELNTFQKSFHSRRLLKKEGSSSLNFEEEETTVVIEDELGIVRECLVGAAKVDSASRR